MTCGIVKQEDQVIDIERNIFLIVFSILIFEINGFFVI